MNYIEGQNIKWDNFVDPFDVGPICRKYKVNSFPTFVLIDPKGRIVDRGIGKVGLEKIKLIISGI
jgi:thioredoxin-related protein